MQSPQVLVFSLSLLAFIVAFSFFVFVYYRQKREADFRHKENEFMRQVSEVEMKALRAQINPHFIFNCLNSIYQYMEKNSAKLAGEYLVKFSNLIRTILEKSENKEVELQEDIYALELYIQLEQLRMNYRFKYDIQVDPGINSSGTFVPLMIVQPFVENSIWHGFNQKKEPGILKIIISIEKDMLKYTLEDNGEEFIPSSEPVTLSSAKKKSMGMSLVHERLEILNKTHNSEANFQLSDIRDTSGSYCGKRMELWLPLLEG